MQVNFYKNAKKPAKKGNPFVKNSFFRFMKTAEIHHETTIMCIYSVVISELNL